MVLPTGENITFSGQVYLYIHPMTGLYIYIYISTTYPPPRLRECCAKDVSLLLFFFVSRLSVFLCFFTVGMLNSFYIYCRYVYYRYVYCRHIYCRFGIVCVRSAEATTCVRLWVSYFSIYFRLYFLYMFIDLATFLDPFSHSFT